MAHVKYSIMELSAQNSIERLLYISSSTYGQDWVSIYHSHSFSELIYVLDGEGTFYTENDHIPIKKDTLVIINPNVKHTETSSSTNPLSYIVLGVDNLQFQFNSEEHLNNYNLLDFNMKRHVILPLLQAMLEECKQNQKFYEQICQHYLTIMLLKITRMTGNTFSICTNKDVPSECEYVKHYMDSHYHENIDLDLLSSLAHQNKFYLSRKFTKTYGISPINYLLERRILHSKNLLRNSNFSITEVARMTGFSSSNYFTQYFKNNTGLSPLKYRQKYDDKDTAELELVE